MRGPAEWPTAVGSPLASRHQVAAPTSPLPEEREGSEEVVPFATRHREELRPPRVEEGVAAPRAEELRPRAIEGGALPPRRRGGDPSAEGGRVREVVARRGRKGRRGWQDEG